MPSVSSHAVLVLRTLCMVSLLISAAEQFAYCRPIYAVAEARRHHVGQLRVTFHNWGSVGGADQLCNGIHWFTGMEFPAGSRLTHFGITPWIGAVREGDTLVSVTAGYDRAVAGAHIEMEIFPDFDSGPSIIERTTRDVLLPEQYSECPPVFLSDSARSEQDIVITMLDTTTDADYVSPNPYESRRHIPLGIKILQQSYAWSAEYATDIVIVEYRLVNITDLYSGARTAALRDVYFGLRTAPRSYRFTTIYAYSPSFNDDWSGILKTWPMPGRPMIKDTLNLVWMADNDGDPDNGAEAVTSAAALRVLSSPLGPDRFSYNWWVGPSYFGPFVWGPTRRDSKVQFEQDRLGRPLTDRTKYQMMSNGEFDYPQWEAALDHSKDNWLPPLFPISLARDVADGIATEVLISIGPFDLDVGDTATIVIAIVGGENFHRDLGDFNKYFDPNEPQHYIDRLDFSDLAKNAQQAAWLYDSPGVDTDGDGYKGDFMIDGLDTVYYRGDGVPDYSGPPPPTPPRLDATTEEAKVILHFNGRRSETELDPFSNRPDFEGYRIYMSRTGRQDDWSLLTGRDIINWARMTWNPTKQRWLQTGPPFTLDSLHKHYDSISLAQTGHPFDPDSFTVAEFDKALLEINWDPENPVRIDSFYHYFTRYEANQAPDDKLLLSAAAAGQNVTGVIRKLYPDSLKTDTVWNDDGTFYLPYYEYEYAIDGLQVAEPIFFAITAFDHGDADAGLAPLESAQSVSQIEVWPINSVEVVNTQRPKPGVYPNPYRLVDSYNAAGWENPRGLEPDPERARRVTFYNVPDTCIVSIWSIDGDLIKRLEHREDPANSEASVVRWNLITRNTQAIKTGIYLYSIESRFGTDVGKLVIIK